MRGESELVRGGGSEGSGPVCGEREGEGVVSKEWRGETESLVLSGSCCQLLSLPPFGSPVLEPHLWSHGGHRHYIHCPRVWEQH